MKEGFRRETDAAFGGTAYDLDPVDDQVRHVLAVKVEIGVELVQQYNAVVLFQGTNSTRHFVQLACFGQLELVLSNAERRHQRQVASDVKHALRGC